MLDDRKPEPLMGAFVFSEEAWEGCLRCERRGNCADAGTVTALECQAEYRARERQALAEEWRLPI